MTKRTNTTWTTQTTRTTHKGPSATMEELEAILNPSHKWENVLTHITDMPLGTAVALRDKLNTLIGRPA